jgi:hypothetical protein
MEISRGKNPESERHARQEIVHGYGGDNLV